MHIRGKLGQRVITESEVAKPAAPIIVPRVASVSTLINPTEPGWKNIANITIPLTAQVLFVPWGTGSTPAVDVQAAHDNRRVIFRMSWEDKTPNKKLTRMSDYSDGAAVMFPLDEGEPSSIMMGFLKPVNIWHWKAARRHQDWAKVYAEFYVAAEKGTLLATHRSAFDHPPHGSDIVDNLATMPGTITPKKNQQVEGKAVWNNGRWYVTYSRSLASSKATEDVQFKTGDEFWTAFAVWDGERKERASRKSIADWVPFVLEESRAAK